jgi:hypothetical protein
MLHSYALKTCALLLAAAFALAPISAMAKNGHEFSGFYSVDQITEQEDQLVISLSVQLFNYSQSDIQGAVITLRPTLPSPHAIGSFRTVKLWRDQGEVRMTRQFTISRLEYDRWQQNGQPQLFVAYRDADGNKWERFVQVASRSALH